MRPSLSQLLWFLIVASLLEPFMTTYIDFTRKRFPLKVLIPTFEKQLDTYRCAMTFQISTYINMYVNTMLQPTWCGRFF